MSAKLEALIASGYEARRQRRPDDAKSAFSEAIALSRGVGDRVGDQAALAQSLCGLGQIERDLGNTGAALKHYREAAELYAKLPYPLRFAHTVRHVADILRESEAFEEAFALYEEALAIYREHGEASVLDVANTLRGFAVLSESTGETARAKELWCEARSLYEIAGVLAGVKESEKRLEALRA